MMERSSWVWVGCLLGSLASVGCSSDEGGGSAASGGSGNAGGSAGNGASSGNGGSSGSDGSGGGGGSAGLPPSTLNSNEYSWDGSWSPAPSDFPVDGLLDPDPTQQGLPPGRWGWDGNCSCAGNDGTAIYDNEFVSKGLDWEKLEDTSMRHFGWRLIDTDSGTTDLDHRGDAFDGSSGVDIFDLTSLSSTGPGTNNPGVNLGEGPDMLRYQTGKSVDMRTGATDRGAMRDNDLVILGSENELGLNQYDINGTTIHTGPGSDLVFAQNFGPAALDLGNGDSGKTDTSDPSDGDDMAILSGNMRDFRVYGGGGDDVFVWYVDEVVDDRFLGPNFYGGGGWGDALWGDPGVDRLILAVDPNTEVVAQRGQHDNNPGSLLALVYSNYMPSIDAPTENDPFARYYGTAPVGPNGEHTVTLSYRSPDGNVFTHDFYVTAVEELQLGTGNGAKVFDIDSKSGALNPSSSAPLTAIPQRAAYNQLFDSFGR